MFPNYDNSHKKKNIFNDCKSSGSPIWDGTQTEVYHDFFSQYKFPVFYGLIAGHSAEQLTLPLGLSVKINSDLGTITLTSAITAD